MHCPDSAARRRWYCDTKNRNRLGIHRSSAPLAADFGYFAPRSHFENKIHQINCSATFGHPACTPNGIPVSRAGP